MGNIRKQPYRKPVGNVGPRNEKLIDEAEKDNRPMMPIKAREDIPVT